MPERTTERHRAGQPRRPRAFRLRVGRGGHTGAGQSEANSDGVSYATNTAAHRHCPHPKPVEVCGGAEHGAPLSRVTAEVATTPPNGASSLNSFARESAMCPETAAVRRWTGLFGTRGRYERRFIGPGKGTAHPFSSDGGRFLYT